MLITNIFLLRLKVKQSFILPDPFPNPLIFDKLEFIKHDIEQLSSLQMWLNTDHSLNLPFKSCNPPNHLHSLTNTELNLIFGVMTKNAL